MSAQRVQRLALEQVTQLGIRELHARQVVENTWVGQLVAQVPVGSVEHARHELEVESK